MKKKLKLTFSCLAISMAMLFVLCACGNSFGKIKAAYEDAGYTQSELTENLQKDLMAALNAESEEEVEQVCKIHVFAKGLLTSAVILEFSSTKEMEEQIQNSATLKGMISDIQNSDLVNKNCLLFFYTPLTDGLEIFKGTK